MGKFYPGIIYTKLSHLKICNAVTNPVCPNKNFALLVSVFIFFIGMVPIKGFCTDFTSSWTSVVPSSTCASAVSNYTLSANTVNDPDAAISAGKAVVITFPAGFTLSGISGGTMNGVAIGSISTTSNTISFNVPTGGDVAANSSFTIILNGITNSSANNYQLSMTIDNLSGTGAGNQNIYAVGASSEFTINPIITPSVTISANPGNTICAGSSVTFTATPTNGGSSPLYQWRVNGLNVGSNSSVNTFTTTTLTNGSVVTVVLTSNANPCLSGNPVSSNSISMVVNAIPTITGTTPGSNCGTGTVTLSATASSGTINWYAASSGGVSLGTGTSFTTSSISSTTTYYVDATANGCTTGTRTAVIATINPIPTITGTTPGSNCGTGTVTLGATASSGIINWYAASSGGASLGTGTSFTTPSISSTTTYYVDAIDNSCTTGSRTAVIATINTIPTITGTTPGINCGTGTVTLSATASSGTINWYAAASGGASLGTGTSFTTPSISSTTTYYVDATDNSCTTGSRTAVIATINTIPTITGTTPGSNCGTGTVTLGATASSGTINWYAASTGGASLGTGTSFTTPSISSTTTYYVDATANGCTTGSRTAVVASINTIPTITGTTPGSNCGTGTVTLSAAASSGTINWYAASSGGASLGTGTSFTTPSISSTTTYYVDATANGCTTGSRTAVLATINTVPTITSTTPGNICTSGSTTLSATASAGTINWYAASSGGASLATGTNFTTPNISSTTTYYVDATANGCTTGARTAVTATVNAIPTITSTTSGSRCNNGVVTLSATASAGTINWYAASSGGSSLASGTSYSPNISATTTYYVDATINGCTTGSRTTVTATKWTSAPSNSGGSPANRSITGVASICPGPAAIGITYDAPVSLTNTETYTWTIPPGFSITSGAGTSQITVSVPGPGAVAGPNTLTLVASNPCGSISVTKTITINSFNAVNAGSDFSICYGTNPTLTNILSGASSRVTWRTSTGTVSGGPYPTAFVYTPPVGFSGIVTLIANTDTAVGNCAGATFDADTVLITVNQPSVAPTSLSASVPTICNGSSTTLTQTGGSLGTGASWKWYSDNTFTTLVGTGSGANASLSVNPTVTTTYYLRAESSTGAPCTANVAAAGSVTITVSQPSVAPASLSASPSTICNGNSSTLTQTGGSLGTGASWKWYSDNSYSTLVGTSALANAGLSVSPTSTTTYFLRAESSTGAPCTANVAAAGSVTVTVNQPSVAPTSLSTSIATICNGSSTTLTQTGGSLGTGASWKWYSDNTYTTLVGTGVGANASLSVSPTVTTTYYLRAESSTGTPCTSNVAAAGSVTVTVSQPSVAPTSLIASPATICNGNITTLTQIGGSLGTGASWKWYSDNTYTTLVGSSASANASLSVSPAATTTYYLRAESSTGAPCAAIVAAAVSVTVTVNQPSVAPTSLSASTSTICNGSSTTLTQTGGSLGTGASWNWYSDNTYTTLVGTGVGANASLSVSPTVTTTYYLRAESSTGAPCTANVAAAGSVTVTVNQPPLITSQPAASQTVCSSFPVSFSVSATGTGLIYQWYKDGNALADTAGIISGVTTSNLNISQAAMSQAGTYTVKITGTAPCTFVISNDAVLAVNRDIDITTQPASQVICQNSNPTFTVITTGSISGYVWRKNGIPVSGGNFSGENTATLTINNVSLSDAGNYDVVISGTGTCPQVISSAATLSVTPTVGTPTAITISAGAQPTCQLTNGTTTTTYLTTATNSTGFNWSLSNAAAGSINASTGVMTWANGFSGSVDIQVTANGCNGPSAQTIRTVNITPTVGTPTSINVSVGSEPTCQLTNGTTTTTYATTATNNTGFNWSLSNAAAGSINASTGVMAWANGFSGTVDIRVTANGCNGPSAQTVRTVNITPTVGTPTAITISSGIEPTCQLTNGTTTTTYATTATNSTGFNWSLSNPAAGSIDPVTGVMTWANNFSGSVDIRVTANGCNGPSAQTIRTVNVTPTVGTPTPITISAGAQPTCQLTNGTTTTTYSTTATNNTGFNWSMSNAAAGSINASTGVMTWVNGFSGSVDIQVTANGCNGPSAQTVRTVNITPTVGTPTAITISAGSEPTCQLTNGTTTTTYATTATNSTGFNWSLSNAAAGSINASTGVMTWANGFSGSVDIRVTANGCNGPSAQTVRTVNITPTVGTPTAITISAGAQPTCQLTNGTTTTTYSSTATNSTGFNWSLSNAAAGSINSSTGVMTWANGFSGSVDIRVTANGCNGPSAQTVRTVNITPTVGTPTAITISAGAQPTCQLTNGTTTTTYATTATNSTGFNWSLSNAAAGSINASTGVMTWANGFSGSADIQVTANGCNGPSAQTVRTVNITPTVGTPTAITISAGAQPTCQLTNGTTTTTYSSTATNSTGFNWSLSNAAAGSINASSGVMTWANGFSGSVDIRVTANGCNGPSAQTIRTVNVTPTVGTPTAITISAGSEPTCQLTNGTTTTTYSTTATNSTGFNWSISNAAAGSINASTGIMTWANGFSGSVDIRVTANGCNGPSSQTIRTVNITPTVGTPVFVLGSSSARCQGISTVTYTATASNSTGITYSLDATSLGAGNSINSSTGAVTYAATWNGTSVITATAIGCNGSPTATHTVTINQVPVGGTLAIAGSNPVSSVTTLCPSVGSNLNGATINLTGGFGSVTWQMSTNGGTTWVTATGTATQTSLTVSDLSQTTIYRAVRSNTTCTDVYSAIAVVQVIPPYKPSPVVATPNTLCLGQSAILTAATGYPMTGIGTTDGDFNNGASDDKLWTVRNNGAIDGNALNAGGDNGNPTDWRETVGNNYLGYQSPNPKFAITHGVFNTSLESPVFSLIGQTSATMTYIQSYNFSATDTGRVEISTDGGATYTLMPNIGPYIGPVSDGGPTVFKTVNLDLSNYIGQSNLRIRFNFKGHSGNGVWAIDDLSTPGTSLPINYSWSGTILSSSNGTPVTATPTKVGVSYYTIKTMVGGCPGGIDSVAITVNPVPVIGAIPTAICSGTAFSVTPQDGNGNTVPAGTKYTWSTPVVTGGITGDSAQSTAVSSISQTLVNPTNVAQTATYTVTPITSANCTGNNFTVTVTVNPTPFITPQTSIVCSGSAFSVTPANGNGNIVPAGTTYTWLAPVVTGGITGGSAQNTGQSSISQTLTNPTSTVQTATYTVTPVGPTCTGAAFTVTVSVNPTPFILPQSPVICSGSAFTVQPVDGGGNTVPAGTNYTWTAPTVTGGITGGSAQGVAQPSISQTLTNSTNVAQTATYTITPVGPNCTGPAFTIAVTVNPSAVVSAGPDQTICSGTSAIMSGSFSGGASSATWSTSGTGTFSNNSGNAVYTPSAADSLAGSVVLTYTTDDPAGPCSAVSSSMTLTINPAVNVITQPQLALLCPQPFGSVSTTFNVNTGATAASHQWQVSTNGGAAWTNVVSAGGVTYSGATTNALTISGIDETMEGYQYRDNISGLSSCTAVNSQPGTLFIRNIWKGTTSTSWGTNTNWWGDVVPDINCEYVVIPTVSNGQYPILVGNETDSVRNIVIRTGASVQVTGSATLEVRAKIYADMNETVYGRLDGTDGRIELKGGRGVTYTEGAPDNVTQNIAGSLFYRRTLKDLKISNPLNVTVANTPNDTLNITGHLSFGNPNPLTTSFTLFTGDNVTLKSSAAGTASVDEILLDGSGNPSNAITGKVIVERYIPAHRAWRFLTFPFLSSTQTINDAWQEGVVNQTLTYPGGNLNPHPGFGTHITGIARGTDWTMGYDAGPQNNFSLKIYDSSRTTTDINGYQGIQHLYPGLGTYVNLKFLQGYALFVRGDRSINMNLNTAATPTTTVLRGQGILNTGTQPPIPTANNFTLIGNPYAATIDARGILQGGAAPPFIYVYDPRLGSIGGFQSLFYQNGNYVPVPGGGSYAAPYNASPNYIQSSQAFFVQSANGPSVIIKESAKELSTISTIFRTTRKDAQLRTNLIATNQGNTLLDATINVFSADGNNAVDQEDGQKIAPLAAQTEMSLSRGNKKLFFERRELINKDDTIFYNLATLTRRNYKLEFIADNLNQDVVSGYLIDSYLKSQTPVDLKGTTTVNFTVNSDPASAAPNRFMLVFQGTPKAIIFTKVDASQKDADIVVDWSVTNEVNIRKYDIETSSDGQHFVKAATLDARGNDYSDERYQWIDADVKPGVYYYRVRSTNITGEYQYSNVVKVIVTRGRPDMKVYPNPVVNGRINVQMISQPEGNYKFKLMNGLGQVILTKDIVYHTGENIVTIKVNTAMANENYRLEVTKPDNSTVSMNVLLQ